MSAYRLMGIVNVTPDSFSDGGLFLDADDAIAHGAELAAQGAHILDVGGESTRPGADPVGVEEELRRVVPVIGGLAERTRNAQISIDTSKAEVARAALAAGASLVNDVTALRGDPEMVGVVADSGAECCLMHMLGEPRTMQRGVGGASYTDVVDEVKAFLEARLAFAVGQGVDEHRVLLDPGIGFGKAVEHNLSLLVRLDELVALGRPIVIGTSRKSFLGKIVARARHGDDPERVAGEVDGPGERLAGTIATNVLALERGASVFRVHDVAPVGEALSVAAATLSGKWTARSANTTS